MPRPVKKTSTSKSSPSKKAGSKGPPPRGASSKKPAPKGPSANRGPSSTPKSRPNPFAKAGTEKRALNKDQAGKSGPNRGGGAGKGAAGKGGPNRSGQNKGPAHKNQTNAPTKPVNPFGEKKQSAGKKWGSGSKAFKARQEDEALEIKLSDRDAALVNNIKAKLQQIRDYKAILAEDGLKPDDADKAKESALIQTLLKMEKAAKIEARQRAKVAKTEAFRENAEKEMFAREKKKGRADRYSGENSDDEGNGKGDHGRASDGDEDFHSDYDEEDDDQNDDDLDDE